jgi:membrane protein DedA with SNARE-associated domain
MEIQEFLANLINLIGTYSPLVGLSLFVLCLFGEVIGVGIPYVLEAALMLAGYNASINDNLLFNVVIIMIMTLTGRLVGTLIIYYLARRGEKLTNKIRTFFESKANSNSFLQKMTARVNLMSPFSVAAGRLLWLRYPITLLMAAQGKLKVLMLGTVLSSVIYDGVYMVIGAVVGANTTLEPVQVIICFMAGLTVVYLAFYIAQRLREKYSK